MLLLKNLATQLKYLKWWVLQSIIEINNNFNKYLAKLQINLHLFVKKVTAYDFVLNTKKNQNGGPNMADNETDNVKISSNFRQIILKLYISGVFEITDNDVIVKHVNIKMANLVWPTLKTKMLIFPTK